MMITLNNQEIEFLTQKAKEKIAMESWGERAQIKAKNFANCFITEEAFKKLLAQQKKWCRYRGLYVGDADGAGKDFIIKKKGVEKSIGIRSISTESLKIWKSMAYPNDRYEGEQEKIADYIIVCSLSDDIVTFHCWLEKHELLKALSLAKPILSRKNKEKFRTVSLERFHHDMTALFTLMDEV